MIYCSVMAIQRATQKGEGDTPQGGPYVPTSLPAEIATEKPITKLYVTNDGILKVEYDDGV